MGQQIGRTGLVYAKDHTASYAGGSPVFSATDALRHLEIHLLKDLHRSNSLERRPTPGLLDRFSRHTDASFDLKAMYLSPSGTIQVAPNCGVILRNGFGSERIGTLSTTVASGPTTTGATLTSATGLAVNDGVVINCTGGSAPGRYVRFIASISGAVVTWTPALPQAPATSDTVKQGVTYQPTTALPPYGFDIAHYLTDISRELSGAVVEKLAMMFDGNDECKISASGPGQDLVKPAQSKPGAFTVVGSPVTGISGYLYKDGTAIKLTKFQFDLNNLEKLINDSFGASTAEDHFRNGRRDVALSFDQRQLTSTDFYDAAVAASDFQLFAQAGKTEGSIIGVLAPRCEIDIPDMPNPDGEIINGYKGVCKETVGGLSGSATGGNDELLVCFA
jgi:hypothetical protein